MNNIYKQSRSDWLKFPVKPTQLRKAGKKRFEVHKNQHNVLLYPDSSSEIKNSYLDVENSSKTPQPQRVKRFTKLEPLESAFYVKRLKEKETELSVIKDLYKATTHKLLEYEKKIILSSRIRPAEEISDLGIRRGGRTPDLKRNNYLGMAGHPAFVQPKYTKCKPKIVLSNPITGIAPRYEDINSSF
ncbi:hypothetical protein SteCoe_34727 [Stentor coeruleus]|uniref:Uncharacterized protein n=1 Tax=Stentor coeruleus TaxID=5963 RepID=A0A1R2ATX9_9CILI|nr:hypothetical protein SteCoe_34727 [Stentor coeruleus]